MKLKVFISWSGTASRTLALALRDWLPVVLPGIDPFDSNRDIAIGKRWACDLAQQLERTEVGILCVTPFNLDSPWLNFEAGALSKAVEQAYLMPILFGVERSNLQDPLAQFQSTLFTKAEMWKLVVSLNNLLKEERMSDEDLLKRFQARWPKLRGQLQGVIEAAIDETETGFPWCFSAKDLERRELDPKAKSVWVITPWPYQDVQLACLVGMLRRKIDQGVKYTFIIPRDPTGQAPKVLHGMFAGKIVVHEVEADRFESLAVTHYVVLNPEYDEACHPRVFLEIPTEERGNWIETSPEAAIKFTNRFRQMIPPDPRVEVPMAICTITGTEASVS
ncbi:MAG TPA: toll/interleukin-1 receptor domain-containing protein [Thermoanaerobaculia bacterium]